MGDCSYLGLCYVCVFFSMEFVREDCILYLLLDVMKLLVLASMQLGTCDAVSLGKSIILKSGLKTFMLTAMAVSTYLIAQLGTNFC